MAKKGKGEGNAAVTAAIITAVASILVAIIADAFSLLQQQHVQTPEKPTQPAILIPATKPQINPTNTEVDALLVEPMVMERSAT